MACCGKRRKIMELKRKRLIATKKMKALRLQRLKEEKENGKSKDT
jgi:hypothetical protein